MKEKVAKLPGKILWILWRLLGLIVVLFLASAVWAYFDAQASNPMSLEVTTEQVLDEWTENANDVLDVIQNPSKLPEITVDIYVCTDSEGDIELVRAPGHDLPCESEGMTPRFPRD